MIYSAKIINPKQITTSKTVFRYATSGVIYSAKIINPKQITTVHLFGGVVAGV